MLKANSSTIKELRCAAVAILLSVMPFSLLAIPHQLQVGHSCCINPEIWHSGCYYIQNAGRFWHREGVYTWI